MKHHSRPPGTPSKLSDSVHHQLNMYALAASAAGVGMLALVPPTEYLLPAGVALAGLLAAPEAAQAKIVYTHANKVIPRCSSTRLCFKLDLNHDKITDFNFFLSYEAGETLAVRPARKTKNQVWGTISTARGSTGGGRTYTCTSRVASALSSHVSVGPNSVKFQPGNTRMWGYVRNAYCFAGGQWENVKNKYLGLMFHIKGKVHYGWARLSTTSNPRLTGYAYETIANKPIITGKTKGPDVITLEPGSLGALAAGAARFHSGK